MLETSFLIGIVIGLTEAIKRAGGINRRYIPIVSILVSLLVTALALQAVTADGIFTAFIVGLTASGLYSGTKATVGK
jgi:Kef-type K+ transport system membrane component KefB